MAPLVHASPAVVGEQCSDRDFKHLCPPKHLEEAHVCAISIILAQLFRLFSEEQSLSYWSDWGLPDVVFHKIRE